MDSSCLPSVSLRSQSGFPHRQPPVFTHSVPRRAYNQRRSEGRSRNSVDGALANITEAIELCLEDMRAYGEGIYPVNPGLPVIPGRGA